jgi:hypothetical protein
MGLQNTRMRWHGVMRCSLEFDALHFVKYLHKMGLPKHTHLIEMTWCDALISLVWCLVFCKIFARWVYINTRMRWRWQQCVAVGVDALFFVKYLQDGFTSTHARDEDDSDALRSDLMQSTESPILDASFWSENGVSCSHERNKIGDAVLWFDALHFCKIFARWVYLNTRMRTEHGIPDFWCIIWSENGVSCPQCGHERNKIGDSVLYMRWHEMAMRSSLSLECDAVVFCKIFARWVYPLHTHAMTWHGDA